MRSYSRRFRFSVLFATSPFFLLFVLGCHRDPWGVGHTVPVVGKVTLEGEPLTMGSLVLVPDASRGNTAKNDSSGEIDSQGMYKIFTGPKEGAPLGWYKVGLVSVKPIDPNNMYAPRVFFVKQKMGNPDKSGLTLEVVENAPPGTYDIELTKDAAAPIPKPSATAKSLIKIPGATTK